jgi:isocitrate dehydrogenase (NAD+)
MPNLYGDIVSDLACGPGGRAGRGTRGQHRKEIAVFEPVPRFRTPKYAGQDKVNPTATILSAAC